MTPDMKTCALPHGQVQTGRLKDTSWFINYLTDPCLRVVEEIEASDQKEFVHFKFLSPYLQPSTFNTGSCVSLVRDTDHVGLFVTFEGESTLSLCR